MHAENGGERQPWASRGPDAKRCRHAPLLSNGSHSANAETAVRRLDGGEL